MRNIAAWVGKRRHRDAFAELVERPTGALAPLAGDLARNRAGEQEALACGELVAVADERDGGLARVIAVDEKRDLLAGAPEDGKCVSREIRRVVGGE